MSASAHRLVFYGYSVNDSSRRIHDALFKNMTKNIPGLTDCASEYTVLFSDIATAPLLSFCISGGDTRECVGFYNNSLPLELISVAMSLIGAGWF